MLQPTNYTCSICSKSFEKRSSQVRHISYCRTSKSRGRSRKKACLVCTRAKTHCDGLYPSCSRCAAKNLTCRYEGPRPPTAPVAAPSTASTEIIRPELIATLPLGSSSQSGMQLVQAGQNGIELPFARSLENCGPASTLPTMLNMSYPDPISSQNNRDPLLLSYSEPNPSVPFLNSEVENIPTFDHLVPRPPRAFSPSTMRNHQSSLNMKYMIRTLRSYPFTMLPGKSRSLPAFIHPQCISYGSKHDGVIRNSLSSPLENCLAIMQMWSVKNEANATFIWRSIRMEQDRLYSESSQYDDWSVVAGLQAITVYILLRLSEKDDETVDFDLPLLRTMIKFALHTCRIRMRHRYSSNGSSPSWESWVLVESLHRTLTVLFLINILFDYTSLLHPYTCDGSELLEMDLPCGRGLWQASSRSEWEREYALRAEEKQLTYGDLLKSRFKTDHTLDSWLEQLDDFGTLVMAAASLRDGEGGNW